MVSSCDAGLRRRRRGLCCSFWICSATRVVLHGGTHDEKDTDAKRADRHDRNVVGLIEDGAVLNKLGEPARASKRAGSIRLDVGGRSARAANQLAGRPLDTVLGVREAS